jgi:hypothetical protein
MIDRGTSKLGREGSCVGPGRFDTKPIEFDRLVATVRRILANRK